MRWRRFFLSKLKLKLPVQHSSCAELSQYLARLSCSCPEREWVQPGVSAAAQFMQHQEGLQDRCILPALRAASRTPACPRRDPGDHVEPSGDRSETIPTEAASHSKLPGFLWSCNVCTLVYSRSGREPPKCRQQALTSSSQAPASCRPPSRRLKAGCAVSGTCTLTQPCERAPTQTEIEWSSGQQSEEDLLHKTTGREMRPLYTPTALVCFKIVS